VINYQEYLRVAGRGTRRSTRSVARICLGGRADDWPLLRTSSLLTRGYFIC